MLISDAACLSREHRDPSVCSSAGVGSFWRAFEKPSGSYCYKRGKCTIAFGRGRVRTSLFHYPQWRGLSNLKPSHFSDMCAADLVLLESAFEDLALPPPAYFAKAKTAARNESWRWAAGAPLAIYEQRLRSLLDEWRRCRDARATRAVGAERSSTGMTLVSGGGGNGLYGLAASGDSISGRGGSSSRLDALTRGAAFSSLRLRPPWRPIFALAAVPRSRGLHAEPRAADCSMARYGPHASDAHHIAEVSGKRIEQLESRVCAKLVPWTSCCTALTPLARANSIRTLWKRAQPFAPHHFVPFAHLSCPSPFCTSYPLRPMPSPSASCSLRASKSSKEPSQQPSMPSRGGMTRPAGS